MRRATFFQLLSQGGQSILDLSRILEHVERRGTARVGEQRIESYQVGVALGGPGCDLDPDTRFG